MQLWKKQNISEFRSLYKGSTIILIEEHFKPTCSRKTSTTHSAKIRRRWSANWVMWSYSSCAKLYHKYNVLTVFFIGIEVLCTALADNAWFTANPEESLPNWDWMQSLSRATWSRKALPMVLDMAKPKKNRVPYDLECVVEMLQESWLPRCTCHRYSRSISQRSSLSWITTRNRIVRTKVQRVGWTCTRRPYISSRSRGKEKISLTVVSYLEQSRQKWEFETSIWLQSRCLDEKPSTPRIRRTSWRAYPSRSTKTNTTRTRSFLGRLLLQRSSWPTYRMGILAFISKFLMVVRVRMDLEVSS